MAKYHTRAMAVTTTVPNESRVGVSRRLATPDRRRGGRWGVALARMLRLAAAGPRPTPRR